MDEARSESWLHEVLQRHEQALTGYALRLVREVEAARDVTQDTFLALCRHPMDVDDPHLGPWLYTVCRNRAIDRLRKERRMHLLDQPDATPAVPTAAPDLGAERRESAQRLVGLCDELPPRQREVVWLRFRGGLSYAEIAEVTKTSVGNVGFVLHEALKRLRERLVVEARVASARTENAS